MTYLCPCKSHVHKTPESHARSIEGARKGGHIAMSGKSLSLEHRAKIKAALRGKCGHPVSQETRDKIRIAVSAAQRGVPETEQTAMNIVDGNASRRRANPTRWESALRRFLHKAGFTNVWYEGVFGRHATVDAYIPSHQIAFEADCHWRHGLARKSGHEEARDVYLIQRGVLAIIHLSVDDLRPFLERKAQ